MMVQQESSHRQAPPLLRSERRKIELEKRRLQKKISRYNLPTTFDNHTVTRFANFGLIEAFKQAIGFKNIISNSLTMRKAPNSKFQPPEMLDFLIDAQILGLSRFDHTQWIRNEQGYAKIKGIDDFPEETGFRRLLAAMQENSLEELRSIDQQLREMRSKTVPPREI